MLDWTDRHDRFFLRLISRRALLYTEMVTTGALLHGDAARHLGFDAAEQPLALQLGGSDPDALARCAEMAQAWGYDEVNLNCGCPSDRVQSGRFGACLMAEPALVGRAVAAMRRAVDIPVTVKHRIGIDDQEDEPSLRRFITTVADLGGCTTFIIHARKAWLKGLSPKENREVPPLRYELVYRMKQELPELEIILNGGIRSLADAQTHLAHVDGVMMGREAYQNPYILAAVDRMFFDDPTPPPSREQVIEALLPYVTEQLARGVYLGNITRHILGLFQGCRGARHWRRTLSENAHRAGAGVEVIRAALPRAAAA